MAQRAETGPMQFGNDWPGLFVRGDNAAHYAFALERCLAAGTDGGNFIALRSLLGDLQSSRVRDDGPAASVQRLCPFEEAANPPRLAALTTVARLAAEFVDIENEIVNQQALGWDTELTTSRKLQLLDDLRVALRASRESP